MRAVDPATSAFTRKISNILVLLHDQNILLRIQQCSLSPMQNSKETNLKYSSKTKKEMPLGLVGSAALGTSAYNSQGCMYL